jgi:hypothetical protein
MPHLKHTPAQTTKKPYSYQFSLAFFSFNTQFGTAGASDFTEKSQRITFQPGQSGPIAVEIEIEDDTQIESTEAFQVTISDPSYTVGMGGPATVNILDNDGKALMSRNMRHFFNNDN